MAAESSLIQKDATTLFPLALKNSSMFVTLIRFDTMLNPIDFDEKKDE